MMYLSYFFLFVYQGVHEELKKSLGISLDTNIQLYSDILRWEYNHQHIVEADWPTRYGDDFFGRLVLLESKDNYTTANSLNHKAFYLLRGRIDEISYSDESKELTVEDVLKPNDDHHPLRVVVDGPPGIGKTTLCRKILKMWANGEITHTEYDLVLYCPLRDEKVANASTLTDLFTIESQKITSVVDWITQREGKGLLIIFDGWDELSEQNRQISIAAKIICRKNCVMCSVIVTSRTYASASLLKLPSVDRHVEVVGFSEDEVKEVIRGTLREDPDQAQKLIENLEIRGDALSLCYIPLICSIVISVCRTKEIFPVTLTGLYQDFILQTIRRHVEINKDLGLKPEQINCLDDLPPVVSEPMNQLCKLAYNGLKEKNPKMTFTTSELNSDLGNVAKRKYLGLMNTFTVYDKKNHQFLHLTVQEFLAAMWIAKYDKGEEVIKNYYYYGNDHFRMCLRFVAGLTHLENIFYQVIKAIKDQRTETVNNQSNTFSGDQNFQLAIQEQGLENTHEELFENIEDAIHEWHEHFSDDLDEEFDCPGVGYSCHRVPAAVYEYEAYRYSRFHQNIKILPHHFEDYPTPSTINFFIFQILYEAQNISYCQELAEELGFTENPSLCLDRLDLSPFDMLCISYFLQNSNMTWNYLHFGYSDQVKIFADSLIKNSQQSSTCNILHIDSHDLNMPSEFWSSSFLCNVTECYYQNKTNFCNHLLELLNLSKLKVLHYASPLCSFLFDTETFLEQCSKIEQSLHKNCVVEEVKFVVYDNFHDSTVKGDYISRITTSFIDGIKTNKSIKSFSIKCYGYTFSFDTSVAVISLLKCNHTLQALQLYFPEYPGNLIESMPSTIKVNAPLTAVDIRGNTQLRKLIIQNCKSLHFVGYNPPFSTSELFLSQLFLQQLDLSLCSVEHAIELFSILKSNSTLTVLKVTIENEGILADSTVGVSLKHMLEENMKIQHLEILLFISYEYQKFFEAACMYLPCMTDGLKCNYTLRGLHVPIPLSHASGQNVANFLKVISDKYNIRGLHLNIIYDQNCDEENKPSYKKMTELYCSLQLPLVSKMLKKNFKMRILKIIFDEPDPYDSWTGKEEIPLTILQFFQIVFSHPSLQYLYISHLLDVDPFRNLIKRFYNTHHKSRTPYVTFDHPV